MDLPLPLVLVPLAIWGTMGLSQGPAWSATEKPPQPVLLNSRPPLLVPDPRLEAALRRELFPVRVEDGQGHGPDPGSSEWKQAEAFKQSRACAQVGSLRYAYDRVDLNGDGSPEIVATVQGPYTCGTGGCNFYVFRNGLKGPTLVSRMTLFRPPLIVSEQKHHGWKDLIVNVRQDAGHGGYAVLSFDGRGYPSNPSAPPAQPLRHPLKGTALLVMKPEPDQGLPLPCAP
ncbi:hypothetical protein [Cyanobium sp. ATX-6F1]|uniref:hypothetical protein n=1 Tax=Cyanobium sp. ATX-6F1 TaxID=3137388 RepID=UPI0039BEBCD1